MTLSTDPFERLHPGEKRPGVLLCHGFTGTPAEVREFGEWLFTQGFNVCAVRLPGHGTSPEDLSKTVWHDWYEHLQAQFKHLRELCDRVFLLGVSLGGLLSLRLAAEQGLEVAGVVTMGTPLVLADKRAIRPLLHLGRLFISSSHTDVEAGQEGYYYDERPLVSILQLLDARDAAKAKLQDVRCPVLVMHSRHDKTASFRGVKILIHRLKSPCYVYSTDHPEHVFLPPYNNVEYLPVWQIIHRFFQHPAQNPLEPL